MHDLDASGDAYDERALRMEHGSTVLCVAIASDGLTAITGSSDCTARIWCLDRRDDERGASHGGAGSPMTMNGDGGGSGSPMGGGGGGEHLPAGGHDKSGAVQPIHVLCTHAEAVVAVAISCELNVCVTGSTDCTVAIHDLIKGRLIRRIRQPESARVHAVAISPDSHVLVHSHDDESLHLFNINGSHLAYVDVEDCLTGLRCVASSSGFTRYILTVGLAGLVAVRRVHDLATICSFDLGDEGHGQAHSVTVSDSGQSILVGMDDGQVLVITKPAFRLQAMAHQLSKGFAGFV